MDYGISYQVPLLKLIIGYLKSYFIFNQVPKGPFSWFKRFTNLRSVRVRATP